MLLSRLTLLITLLLSCSFVHAQGFKKAFKFATFYSAVNGGNSVADQTVWSVSNGLNSTDIETPYDYSLTMGIRKIARFGYEKRTNVVYDGTEASGTECA